MTDSDYKWEQYLRAVYYQYDFIINYNLNYHKRLMVEIPKFRFDIKYGLEYYRMGVRMYL